ncbi:hypothetical protein PGT21_031685 [Puccinia graminis f. sp. tritici]|uniref:Uncharacterized protein n=1 Tax=Puccinia graminis f. sp. tritici TaxID=56615 RepID=A0A5B0MZH4_PUCGR|nr:hypothetical protein PGT21_031685 [Puccinia graminis f. sp. tritici]KAA1131391.1 hypothetical protein PGTUg99_033444 [Puccinia graminis f. sp. tritici]
MRQDAITKATPFTFFDWKTELGISCSDLNNSSNQTNRNSIFSLVEQIMTSCYSVANNGAEIMGNAKEPSIRNSLRYLRLYYQLSIT